MIAPRFCLPLGEDWYVRWPGPPKRKPHWRDNVGGDRYRGMKRLRIFDVEAPLGNRCVADIQGPTMARLEAIGKEIGYPESARFAYLR